MEAKTILVDGVPTTIRPMGEDYVVGDDPSEVGIEYAIKCWPGKNVPGEWPNRPIAAYFKKIIRAYGTCAITAWQDKSLVGFLPFMPINCGMPEMTFCVVAPEDKQTPLAAIVAAEPIPFEKLNPKVLKVQCASVAWNKNMYRKGIGSAMARYLVDWSRAQGWERIEGWAFAHSGVDDAYVWIPSIQFWEKAGFQKGDTPTFPSDDPNVNKPACEFSIDLNVLAKTRPIRQCLNKS